MSGQRGLEVPLKHAALVAAIALVSACNQKTALLLDVEGPDGTSSTSAGITTLRLVAAHGSYCGRVVSSSAESMLEIPVGNRDLSSHPVSILVEPDHETDLMQPVDLLVLALGSDGGLLGVASFGAERFFYKDVLRYTARISLFGASQPGALTTDGCLCEPGLPLVGNGSGTGCDALIPPSYNALMHTAGCELPAGASLPLGVCDGQLYPGEDATRTLPCYASVSGACRIGTRACTDTGGVAYASACAPAAGDPALPTSVLCDAFNTCAQSVCADPLPCVEQATGISHHAVTCTLPVSPDAGSGDMGGGSSPCDADAWSLDVNGNALDLACSASMLSGTHVGPFTIGFEDGGTEPRVASTMCPPTLVVGSASSPPDQLPATVNFSLTLGDTIYDVTLDVVVGCTGATGTPGRKLRCTGF